MRTQAFIPPSLDETKKNSDGKNLLLFNLLI